LTLNSFGKMFNREDEILDPVPSPESFTLVVMTLAKRYGITHFEAILEICEHYDREYESVKLLLSPKLKQLLTEEAMKAHQLKDNDALTDTLD